MVKKHMIKNFTPVLDTIVENHDVLTAVVYGRVWRYCQMETGKCFASQEKLADDLGVSIKTIERRLKLLVKRDYLIDLTPERRNKPHEYKPTGRAGIKLEASAFDTTESLTGTSESHSTTSESRSGYDLESVEESSKKENNKSNNKPNTIYNAIIKAWELYFPNKPQPRPNTKSYKAKVATRIRDQHFVDNWYSALQKASKNPYLQKVSWFTFGFFIKNELNYRKALHGDYDWLHSKKLEGSERDPEAERRKYIDGEYSDLINH